MSVEAIRNVSVKASETNLPKMQQVNVNEQRKAAADSNTVIDPEVKRLETVIPSIVSSKKEQQVTNKKIKESQEEKVKEKQQISAAEKKYNEVMTEKAVENANNRIRNTKTNAKFAYNEDINRITITITNQDDEVVKEIPPEATQKMLERIHTFSGMVFNKEV